MKRTFFARALALIVAFMMELSMAQNIAPINPSFVKWQKTRRVSRTVQDKAGVKFSRLSTLSVDDDAELDFGLIPEMFDSSYLANINSGRQHGVADALEASFDSRTQGWLTAIRDQGNYGTCWAHATMSSIEAHLLKSSGSRYDLSENNLANLHGWDWLFDDGGNASLSSAYLLRWCGPVDEINDPYGRPNASTIMDPIKHVQRIRWIPGRTGYLDNDGIKAAIKEFGALYVSYYHSSGYYRAGKSSYCFSGNKTRKTNHAVAVVGWDDNYSKSNFALTPPGDGAFVVRNSWGTSFGENGYFYVSYYDESFGWGTLYSFSNAEATDNYSDIYQYDPLGLVSAVGYKTTTAWGANVFAAHEDSKIAAAGFYALSPNTTYSIYLYANCTDGPTSGQQILNQTGTADYAGYVTVPLSKCMELVKGQKFSVVVKLTTPGYVYPIAYEYAVSGYTSGATASAGQSFISATGDSWLDMTKAISGTANFCCKAYAKSNSSARQLTNVKITGPMSITAGQSGAFKCKASYSDGSDAVVTPEWSVTAGGDFADISAQGVVSTFNVSEQKTVIVKASYREGEITKEDTWAFYVTTCLPSDVSGVVATEGSEVSCVRVSWKESLSATSYAVYRGLSAESSKASYQGVTFDAKWSDTTATPGVDYYYFVKPKNSTGTGNASAGTRGWRGLAAPSGVMASDGSSYDGVEIVWGESDGASHYRILRADSVDGVKTEVGGWQTSTRYVDLTALAGKSYCYYVQAAISSTGERPSEYSVFDDGFRKEPVAVKSLLIYGKSVVVAGETDDYSSLAVYTDGTSNSVNAVWTVVAGDRFASFNGNKLTAATVSGNESVMIQATYVDNGASATGFKTVVIASSGPSAPKTVSITETSDEGVTVHWSNVDNASGYKVYRSSFGQPPQCIAASVLSTTFVDSTAIPGTVYTYQVAAFNGAGESALSSASASGTASLSSPKGVLASNGTVSDKVVISWQSVGGAKFYCVYRSDSEHGSKESLSGWQKSTIFKDYSAAVGVTNYYFVRAAVDDHGTAVSDYSIAAAGSRAVYAPLSSIRIDGRGALPLGASSLFSCIAYHGDDEGRLIAPTWTIDPPLAATITAAGRFAFASALPGSAVTLTASYEERGVARTNSIQILALENNASHVVVTNISVKGRWPFDSRVDVDYDLQSENPSARGIVAMMGFDMTHRQPMKAKTVSGKGLAASVGLGRHRISWDVAADYPAFHTSSFMIDLAVTPVIVEAPTDLTASNGTSNDAVVLTWETSALDASYEIWRSSTNEFSYADVIGVTNVSSFADMSAIAGVHYFYWVRAASAIGVSDFCGPVEGMRSVDESENPLGRAVDCPELEFSTDQTYAWVVDSDTGLIGSSSARSGLDADVDDAISWMETRVVGPGVFSFEWKVSSEEGFDELQLLVDDAIVTNITGETDWEEITLTLPAEEHVIRWEYVKDESGCDGLDSAWVDKVRWVPSDTEAKYCIIDLSQGVTATAYPVLYVNEIPNGQWSDEYKTDKLVLQRMSPGAFQMGSPEAEMGRDVGEVPHSVKIGKTYYIGVFEVTQRQWELVMGDRPSYFSNVDCYGTRPVEKISYDMVRGALVGARWPQLDLVDEASFMGVIRAKTGLAGLDLPTEAQWEYACRASSTSALNNGHNITNESADANVDTIARYSGNASTPFTATSTTIAGTAKAGSYAPNDWGLFDMSGNVSEWCLDWWESPYPNVSVDDPHGANSGSNRVMRGGSWQGEAKHCRSAARTSTTASCLSMSCGFRLALNSRPEPPLPPANVTATDGKSKANVTLAWTGSDNADSYAIYRSLSNDVATAELVDVVSESPYVDKGSVAGCLHYYWVRAIRDAHPGDYSENDSGYQLPLPPANLTASDGAMQGIKVKWDAVNGATSYIVYRSLSNTKTSAEEIATVVEPVYLDGSVATDTTYYYWVKAVTPMATSALSSSDSGDCIATVAPSGVSATKGTYASYVRVSWTAVPGADGYEIWRGSTSSPGGSSLIGTSTSSSYNDSTASHGVRYYYWVKAKTLFGSSDLSASYDSGYKGLDAPTKKYLFRGAYLEWYAVTGATSYQVAYYTYTSEYYHPDSGGNFTIKTVSGTSTSISVSAQRYFWVRACNGVTKSAWVCFGREQ